MIALLCILIAITGWIGNVVIRRVENVPPPTPVAMPGYDPARAGYDPARLVRLERIQWTKKPITASEQSNNN